MIFEDNPATKLQKFLSCYQPPYTVDFSKGSGNLSKRAHRARRLYPDEVVVPVPDLMYDNRNTWQTYKALVEDHARDSCIVPIPVWCSEYYVLLHLARIGKVSANSVATIMTAHDASGNAEGTCKRLLSPALVCGYLEAVCCGEHSVLTVSEKACACRSYFPVQSQTYEELISLNHVMVARFRSLGANISPI